jgi:hypothetical protein
MLIDMNITIAYKCSLCGTFDFFNISLFKLLKKREYYFACRCSMSGITVILDGSSEYKIKMPCISCGSEHIFSFNRRDLFNRGIKIFYCPETGLQQCVIGNDRDVRQKIDSLEKELDELITMFGYDSYFKNTQVMFDTLNKIHDIAEQGNLCCECGNRDVELTLLPDKIHLKCTKCSCDDVINAASNEDLKLILIKNYVTLIRKFPPNIILKK